MPWKCENKTKMYIHTLLLHISVNKSLRKFDKGFILEICCVSGLFYTTSISDTGNGRCGMLKWFQGGQRGSVYYSVPPPLCPLGANSAYWITINIESVTSDEGPYRVPLFSSSNHPSWPKYNLLPFLHCLLTAQCLHHKSASVGGKGSILTRT